MEKNDAFLKIIIVQNIKERSGWRHFCVQVPSLATIFIELRQFVIPRPYDYLASDQNYGHYAIITLRACARGKAISL